MLYEYNAFKHCEDEFKGFYYCSADYAVPIRYCSEEIVILTIAINKSVIKMIIIINIYNTVTI